VYKKWVARCDCGSGAEYRECCRPFHVGAAEPEQPESLVRARFCAFVRKDVDYLWKTLHPDHPDRQSDEGELKRALRETAQRFKFVRLHLLEARADEVLFVAELYERGKERSFLERSRFGRAGGAWRYLSGNTVEWTASRASEARWEDAVA